MDGALETNFRSQQKVSLVWVVACYSGVRLASSVASFIFGAPFRRSGLRGRNAKVCGNGLCVAPEAPRVLAYLARKSVTSSPTSSGYW